MKPPCQAEGDWTQLLDGLEALLSCRPFPLGLGQLLPQRLALLGRVVECLPEFEQFLGASGQPVVGRFVAPFLQPTSTDLREVDALR
jgi:hypothetical protein